MGNTCALNDSDGEGPLDESYLYAAPDTQSGRPQRRQPREMGPVSTRPMNNYNSDPDGPRFGPAGRGDRTPGGRSPGGTRRTPQRTPVRTPLSRTPVRTPRDSRTGTPRRGGSAESLSSLKLSDSDWPRGNLTPRGSERDFHRTENERLNFFEQVKNHVALRDSRGGYGSMAGSVISYRTGDRRERRGGSVDSYDYDPRYDRGSGVPPRGSRTPRGFGARTPVYGDEGGRRTPSRTPPRSGRATPQRLPPTDTRGPLDTRDSQLVPYNQPSGYVALADLASAKNDDEIRTMDLDLKSKLIEAKRSAEEATRKLEDEQLRASKAELQLANARTTNGGSDLEYQLMQNLVQLRSRVDDLGKNEKLEQNKATDARNLLQKERKDREQRDSDMVDIEKKKNELQQTLQTMKDDRDKLKGEVEKNTQENLALGSQLKMVSTERDETIELAERAVKLKEREKKVKMQKEAEIDKLRKHQIEEQETFRNVLGGVDQLLAKLRKTESGGGQQEAIRELLSIRDEMRQMVKKKTQDLVKPTPAGRSQDVS